MSTWGTTTIRFKYDDYSPPHQTGGMIRIDILPNYETPTAKSQVIQQINTGRKTVTGTLILNSYSDYSSLLTDMLNGTARTLTAPEVNASYVIESLGEPVIDGSVIMVAVSFVEA